MHTLLLLVDFERLQGGDFVVDALESVLNRGPDGRLGSCLGKEFPWDAFEAFKAGVELE